MSFETLRVFRDSELVGGPWLDDLKEASPQGKMFAKVDSSGTYVENERFLDAKLCVQLQDGFVSECGQKDGDAHLTEDRVSFLLHPGYHEGLLCTATKAGYTMELYLECASPFDGYLPRGVDIILLGDPALGLVTRTLRNCPLTSLFQPPAMGALKVVLAAMTTSMQASIL